MDIYLQWSSLSSAPWAAASLCVLVNSSEALQGVVKYGLITALDLRPLTHKYLLSVEGDFM